MTAALGEATVRAEPCCSAGRPTGMRSKPKPKPKQNSALPAMVGAGLTVIVAAALAGCGQVRGTASGPGGSGSPAGQAAAGQPRADHSGGSSHRSGGTRAAARTRGAHVIGQLCANPATVTTLRVMRIPSLGQMSGTKPLQRQVPGIVVGDPGRARQLALVICSLPMMPHPAWQCPIVTGGGYWLEFMSGREQFRPVMIQASGCEQVIGIGGGTRWLARTPGFWITLAQLTGIQAPAHSPAFGAPSRMPVSQVSR